MTRQLSARPRLLLLASVVLLAGVGVGVASLLPGAAGNVGPSNPVPHSTVSSASPEVADASASATPRPYRLDEPWLAFSLTSAVIVNGAVTAETDLEGWLAGRSDRWFAIESPGIALPIGRVASLGGTVVAQAPDGTWSTSPQKIYDPWPTLDAGHVIIDGAISCVSGSQVLGADLLGSLMSPLTLPANVQGFLEVASAGDVAAGCRVTTVATSASGPMTTQWSRDLIVSPVDDPTPWLSALQAAGVGPTPTSGLAGPTSSSESIAGGPSDAPATNEPGGSAPPQASDESGAGQALTAFGSLHYEVTLGPWSAPQPTFDVTPTSASYDPSSGELSVNLGLQIGGRDAGLLGLMQEDFAYGLTLKEVDVDGTSVGGVPDVSDDGCQLVAQTSGPQSSGCSVVVPLEAGPSDSVRLYFEMTGATDPPEVGHTAFWVTLIVDRTP